jgi:dienelactone hydrolase
MKRTVPFQEHRRARLWSLLGDLPETASPPEVKSRKEEKTEHYRLERLTLDLNGMEDVQALFVLPLEARGPVPCIVFSHSHGGYYDLGKRELTDGVPYRYNTPMAVELARAGFGAIAIDHWGFGARQGAGELPLYLNMLWAGRVMWGMMVYDTIRTVDYLLTRADVDAARIGTTGMSMGSTMAWWHAALDTRVACCVDTCCLTEFASFQAHGGMHGAFYYVPSLLKHFTTAQINALIAPRPHLALAGEKDPLTPVEGLDVVDMELERVYRDFGAAGKWQLKRYPVAHLETAEMRAATMQFFAAELQGR